MDVPGRAEPLPVEVYRPEGEGPFPAVVVICEAWGLNDDIRRIARRFAAEGYVAAAPDLYRGRHFLRCVGAAMSALQTGKGPEVDDLKAVIAAVGARSEVRAVGVVGFCMGGGYALLLGSQSEQVAAAGDYYGIVSEAVDFDRLCPLFAAYGGRDGLMKQFHRKLERELGTREVDHEVRLYPGAGHSFMNRSTSRVMEMLAWPVMPLAYREDDAEDAWAGMLTFFGRHL